MDRRRVLPLVIDRARRQGGVITRAQILALGGTSTLITRLVRERLLIRQHQSVYVLPGSRVDHGLAIRAALAACGPEALASHCSAAWTQHLVDKPPMSVELVAPGDPHPIRGVVVHRARDGNPLPVRTHQGIRCTAPARTLIDLAASAAPSELSDAVDRALAGRMVRIPDLQAQLEASARRKGVDALRRCLLERGDIGGPAPSVLESKMARLFRRYGLPVPRAELVAGPHGEYRLDYAYADTPERVAVEVYGYRFHHSPDQLANDMARQRSLTIEGWTVLVFTWHDVIDRPREVAQEICAALAAPPHGNQLATPPEPA